MKIQTYQIIIRKFLNIAVGLCFLSLLVNVSLPSFHSKIHEVEVHHEQVPDDHSQDEHSDTCHVCKFISHVYSDIPVLQVNLTSSVIPQQLAINKTDLPIVIIVLGTDPTRAPPLSLT